MDPNIMKLLEDDEDDSMHSGADVDAFAAALNRDIEGGKGDQNQNQIQIASTSQINNPPPIQSDSAGALPQESSSTSNQISTQLQDPKQEKDLDTEKKDEVVNTQQQESASESETGKHETGSEKHGQQVGISQEHNQAQLKLKEEQKEHLPEEKPQQFSQQAGIEKPEQNIAPLREEDRTRPPENQKQYPTLLKTDSQQTPTQTPMMTAESETRNKQVAFGHLLPVITPFLDKDRAMQLQVLYQKLRKNEIHKDEFVRHMRNIVGDQMLRQAVHKIQVQQTKVQAAHNQQTASQPSQALPQTSSQQQQQAKMQSVSAPQLKDSHPFSQLTQKGPRVPTDPPQVSVAKIEVQSDSSFSNRESDSQKREKEHQSDSQGMHLNQVSSSSMGASSQERIPTMQGLNKHQQQQMHLPPQTSYPMYGAHMTNYHAHPYPGQSIGVSSASLRPQLQDSQIRQAPLQHSMIPAQPGGMTQPTSSMNNQNNEIQNYSADAKRLQAGSFSQMTSQPTLQQNSMAWQVGKDRKGTPIPSLPYIKQEVLSQSQEQHTSVAASSSATSFNSGKIDPGNPAPPVASAISSSMPSQLESLSLVRTQVPPTSSSLAPGANMKTPPKKTSIGQKKPLDASGAPSSLTNKKQKVSGGFHDQSIEQLNDVTTVSGVDLREEEEQLFSGPKEESRASEATRRVVQEEEEKLILERIPFQKRMTKIISKFGIKNVNKDVERCLSLCLEERIRGLISNLIRVSKQRVDIERSRHRTIITSDVRRQILVMNRKSKDDWEKKQAEESEKLRKTNEADGTAGTDGEKDKDDGRAKPTKGNKDKDEKMNTTAANVAARVAVGGDDMLSKWQLMAEQARQKREGGDSTSSVITQTTTNKDISTRNKPSSSITTTSGGSGRNSRDSHDNDNRSPSTATTSSGLTRKIGRNMGVMTQTKIARSISVKDVIAVLEREPQMSKSTLVYRLYERMRSDAAARTSE